MGMPETQRAERCSNNNMPSLRDYAPAQQPAEAAAEAMVVPPCRMELSGGMVAEEGVGGDVASGTSSARERVVNRDTPKVYSRCISAMAAYRRIFQGVPMLLTGPSKFRRCTKRCRTFP